MGDTFKRTIRGAPHGLREYACPEHGTFDLVVELASDTLKRPCPQCGAESWRTLETNIITRVANSFYRGGGKRSHADAPGTYMMNTEAIADGMPVEEWRAKREAMWSDHDRKTMKAKGLMP